jgi:cell division protease FtsH
MKKINYNKSIKRIKEGRDKLDQVAKTLKDKFIGIDHIIDSIIESIGVWYVMPEIMQRPAIICLWGMTGVGKTDLIRTLVKELDFNDRFLEVQLANQASDSFTKTIWSHLSNSGIEADEPSILLLDEIQRFRNIDEKGLEIYDGDYQDLWMLLSDGCFANNAGLKKNLMELMCSDLYYDQWKDSDGEDAETKNRNRKMKYHRGYYQANELKNLLRLKDSIEDIMLWDNAKKMAMVMQAFNKNTIFEGRVYSKLVIFIAGNLDEAYFMAHQAEDADHDADVFHKFSLKINIVDIKSALRSRFKPEQVSRFGNNHIIYPSLSKQSYEMIIKKKVGDMIAKIETEHGITVHVDESVYQCIYRNGVFPAQGVRPVISTISFLLGNSIPTFMVFALESRKREIFLRYADDYLIGRIGKSEKRYLVQCALDAIKNSKDVDLGTLNSVHEAGHAVVYAVLHGLAPVQIMSKLASSDAGGFIGCHNFGGAKDDILKSLTVTLAGRVAEAVMFGEGGRTNGAISDLRKATDIAAKCVRKWGFDKFLAVVHNPALDTGGAETNYNVEETVEQIENLLRQVEQKAELIIKENTGFFRLTSETLIKDGSIKPEVFKELAAEFGVSIQVEPSDKTIYMPYAAMFETMQREV